MLGVSFDEILDSQYTTQDACPVERYTQTYTDEDIREIHRLIMRTVSLRPLIFLVLAVLCWISAVYAPEKDPGWVPSVLMAICIGQIIGLWRFSKNLKAELGHVRVSELDCRLYGDYILIQMFRQGNRILESKHTYDEIHRIQLMNDWLIIQIGGRTRVLRRSQLQANSILYSYMYQNPSKTKEEKILDKWWVWSIVLFVASLLSIFGALALVGAVSNINGLFVENMWLFFVMTPIPFASTVLGFILKSKGRKYKKNIIVGIIITALLCIYGSFAFIF